MLYCVRVLFYSFTGGRACLGPRLADMILFLFTANLIQKFEFQTPPGVDPPSDKRVQTGVTNQPEPYGVCAAPLVSDQWSLKNIMLPCNIMLLFIDVLHLNSYFLTAVALDFIFINTWKKKSTKPLFSYSSGHVLLTLYVFFLFINTMCMYILLLLKSFPFVCLLSYVSLIDIDKNIFVIKCLCFGIIKVNKSIPSVCTVQNKYLKLNTHGTRLVQLKLRLLKRGFEKCFGALWPPNRHDKPRPNCLTDYKVTFVVTSTSL